MQVDAVKFNLENYKPAKRLRKLEYETSQCVILSPTSTRAAFLVMGWGMMLGIYFLAIFLLIMEKVPSYSQT